MPQGAAEPGRWSRAHRRRVDVGTTAWSGRYGARCAATPIGPMPGPPPPCGMQKVLCRLRWQTSAPSSAGRQMPDQRVQVGAVHVDLAAVLVDQRADLADALLEHAVGARIGDHQRRQPAACAARPWPGGRRGRRCRSRSQPTTTTSMPAISALAGLVPCAEDGIRHTSRSASPRAAVLARIASRPAYSPWLPALGWSETAAKPGDLARAKPRAAA